MRDRQRSAWSCGFITAIMALLFLQASALADFSTPVAITDVTVVVGTGETISHATILMDRDRILDVGENVTIPADALLIDGSGLIAYPGFIDGQSHMGISEKLRSKEDRVRTEDENPDVKQGPLAATRLANRRGIRPQWSAREIYAPDSKKLQAYRAAGFSAALMAPRNGIFGGTSDFLTLSDRPVRQSVLAANVAMHGSFEAGEDGEYPRSLLGRIAQYRQVLLDARWYRKVTKFYQRHPTSASRIPKDAALEALQPLLGRELPLMFEANSENEIRRALKLAGEMNLNVVITGGREAWKVADQLAAGRVPVIVSLKFDEEPEYGKKKPKKAAATGAKSVKVKKASEEKSKTVYETLKVRKDRRHRYEEQVSNIIRLQEAGVTVALRTSDLESPEQLWKNLRKVIERGWSEDAAVRALTETPAKLFKMGDRLGVIRRGYLANLTLMDKSFVDKSAKVRYVFIEGTKFEIKDNKDKKHGKGKNSDGGADEENSAAEEQDPSEPQATLLSVTQKTTTPDSDLDFASETKADRLPKTRTGGNVLIQHATIIPVVGPTLFDASILIRKGIIQAIGTIPRVPDGVTVIDATGKFAIPGLVDCHSHLGLDGVNEGTLAITAEVRIADLINPHSVGIFRALAGGTTTHHALHGSANPIGGQNASLKLKYGRSADAMLLDDAPPTIKFALGENVTHANSGSRAGNRFPATRMGVESVIRTALQEAKGYKQAWDKHDRETSDGMDVPPLRRDLRLEALADVLSGDLAVHAHCYRSDEILRLLAVAEDFGFRIGTLQHVLEGYRIAPEIARHGCGASTFSNMWAYKMEAYGAIPQNAALMTKHGVNSSVNSDSANTIRYLVQEAAKSIKWGGLDENQALRLVTLNPAMQMQLDNRIGSLEVGKDGDVAIFNGHPLNTFSKCVMTLIEGEVYFEDARPQATEPADRLVIARDVDMTIPETPHQAYAIVGATVHPISSPVLTNCTVVIVEDKIRAVGTDVEIPPGTGVIQGAGLHVYPGLIDAGSTLGLIEIGAIRPTRDSNDIAKLSPELRASSAVHPHSKHIRIARTAGFTTALTGPGGGRISGQSAIIHLDGWTTPEMLVADEFALHVSVPSLPVHLPTDKKRKEKMKKDHEEDTRKLNEIFEQAKHYAKVKRLAHTNPDIGFTIDLKLEAMVPYVRGEKPVVFAARRYKQILDAIAFADEHKLRCVLSGATDAWKLADALAKKDIAVIFGGPLSYPRGEYEPWDAIYRCAGVLDRAGVRFCFASGSASSVYNLPIQVGMAVAHGLSAKRGEYALTLGAAKILGIDARVGSIEVGKLADLIVTTDTPLQTVSRVTHMFIAGKPIELTSMHTESYDRFKNRPAPDLPPSLELRGPPNLTGR